MSHIVEIKTEIRDLDALESAVRRLGGTLTRNKTSYRWYGRYMGDAPLPEGITAADLGKCHHAASFPGCNYEVGIVQTQPGRFILRWDYWESAIKRHLGGETAPKLVQAYAVEAAKLAARRKGHAVTEQTQPDGSIKLVIQTRG